MIPRELTPSSTPGSSRVARQSVDHVVADLLGQVRRVELDARLVEAHDPEQRLDLAEHVRRDAAVREVEHEVLALLVRVLDA